MVRACRMAGVSRSKWAPEAALLALALSLGSRHAIAQPEGLAESLFREARENMKRGDPAQACPKFEESYRLDPSLGTLLNLGLCAQELGLVATAWTKLRQFVDAAPASDPRLPMALQRIAELEPALPKIRILVAAPEDSGTVRLDGVELRGASLGLQLPVDPGEHSLLLTSSAGQSRETRFRVGLGEQLDVSLPRPDPILPVVPAAAVPAARESAEPEAEGKPLTVSSKVSVDQRATPQLIHSERVVAYAAGALGVAGVVTSGVFGLLALKDKRTVREHCPDHHCRDQTGLDAVRAGSRDETMANVALAAGAVAIGVGAILFWHSGQARIALAPGPTSAAISYVGTWP